MATFTDAARSAALTGITNIASTVSLHTANPGSTGANEVTTGTYARQAVSWNGYASQAQTSTTATFNIPAGITIAYYGAWTASGTYLYGDSLAASESYGVAGTYQLTLTLSETP